MPKTSERSKTNEEGYTLKVSDKIVFCTIIGIYIRIQRTAYSKV